MASRRYEPVEVRFCQHYLDYHGYATTEGADTHEDLVHSAVFDFGLPHDCQTQVLAVQGDDFIVSYSTNIAEVLDL